MSKRGERIEQSEVAPVRVRSVPNGAPPSVSEVVA
jgi:hypothetical protein